MHKELKTELDFKLIGIVKQHLQLKTEIARHIFCGVVVLDSWTGAWSTLEFVLAEGSCQNMFMCLSC